jgi:hypothetical protein
MPLADAGRFSYALQQSIMFGHAPTRLAGCQEHPLDFFRREMFTSPAGLVWLLGRWQFFTLCRKRWAGQWQEGRHNSTPAESSIFPLYRVDSISAKRREGSWASGRDTLYIRPSAVRRARWMGPKILCVNYSNPRSPTNGCQRRSNVDPLCRELAEVKLTHLAGV